MKTVAKMAKGTTNGNSQTDGDIGGPNNSQLAEKIRSYITLNDATLDETVRVTCIDPYKQLYRINWWKRQDMCFRISRSQVVKFMGIKDNVPNLTDASIR